MDLLSLASTGLAFFLVAVSPGPATISNATIAMSHGRNKSLVYGAGLSCGLVFWGLIAATGMGAVLQGSLYLLTILKIIGGGYLLWLALQTGRAAWKPEMQTTPISADKRWFFRGLLLNMSNPKSVIAWMAALSIGLESNAGTGAVMAATLVCILVGFATNAIYSLVFSLDGMMLGYQRLHRKINALVAALFALAGLGMIRSAFAD
ncbi:MAG: LysE family translocator [Granulosicoccus sp.]